MRVGLCQNDGCGEKGIPKDVPDGVYEAMQAHEAPLLCGACEQECAVEDWTAEQITEARGGP